MSGRRRQIEFRLLRYMRMFFFMKSSYTLQLTRELRQDYIFSMIPAYLLFESELKSNMITSN